MIDSGGDEELSDLTRHYVKVSDVAVLVFDVTNKSSFEKLERFLSMIADENKNMIAVAAGNKIDLGERAVSTEEAQSRFENLNPPVHYFETSAKTGENAMAMFEYAAQEFIHRDPSSFDREEIRRRTSKSSDKCIIS